MKTTKIYSTQDRYGDMFLFLNEGEAKDNGMHVEEDQLMYEGDIEAAYGNFFFAYFFESEQGWRHTTWCRTKEQAIEMALKEGVERDGSTLSARLSVAMFHEPYLKTREFPLRTVLSQGNKGLYCKLNLHPEIDGIHSSGKFYFPDRSCADNLCEGPVIITEIKDRGTYGFFKGHMRKFSLPADEDLDNYIEKYYQQGYIENSFRFVESEFGSFVLTPHDMVLAKDEKGNFIDNVSFHELGKKGTIVKTVAFSDFICEGYHDCAFTELMNKFNVFHFETAFGVVSSDKFISELLDDAIADKFIKPKALDGVFFVSVDPQELKKSLMKYSREEMQELIETVNDINQKAEAAIKSKIKSGKISLDSLNARRRRFWN